MVLRPTTSPPQARTSSGEPPVASTPVSTKAVSLQPPKPFQVHNENAAQQPQGQTEFLEKLKVPTVVLDTPCVSHTMAAALSLSLLGHTLFLKNQVPFPVAQLSRMPGGKSNTKAAKKRDELVATFDTLASHLQTTFVALSTAYARCKSAQTQTQTHTGPQSLSSSTNDENEDPQGERRRVASMNLKEGSRGTAHLMFVLGTSVGAARARILLTIDGLEVKVWGARADDPASQEDEESSQSSSEEEESDSDMESDAESEADSEDSDSDSGSGSGSEAEDSASEEEDANEESDAEPGPPPSRSPSPELPMARSLAPSPEPLPSPPVVPTPLPAQHSFTFSIPSPCSAATTGHRLPAPSSASAPPQPRLPQVQPPQAPPPISKLSYAEEQQALRAAERLLSRTLMNAWVDGEGDMTSELAPTQTHVYLRAPRRFVHPAWAARQNLTRSLDGVLDAFLEDAGAVPGPGPAGAKKTKSRGVRTEGAWIGCRGGSAFAHRATGGVEDKVGEGEARERMRMWARRTRKRTRRFGGLGRARLSGSRTGETLVLTADNAYMDRGLSRTVT
ncbi:hypothetical protein C8T65DRAFT_112460 [Cerioporus squamosus]|nr:hypothetical protein C8T65DRAFT_112460 [Cerioporus squamosus]